MVDSIDHHVLKEVISDFFEFSLILIENSNYKNIIIILFFLTLLLLCLLFLKLILRE